MQMRGTKGSRKHSSPGKDGRGRIAIFPSGTKRLATLSVPAKIVAGIKIPMVWKLWRSRPGFSFAFFSIRATSRFLLILIE